MKLNEGIGCFELEDVVEDVVRVYRPTVIWDSKDAILIDTGLPGHLNEILEKAEKLTGRQLNKIIITHQDHDHLGSLYEVINGASHNIEVFSHELTKPYIQGEVPLIKTETKVPAIMVDQTIEDNQLLAYCGGISVIFTPGHTPDHISLYHHPTKTLITGDALLTFEGQLQYPSQRYTLDMEQAIVSINRFLDYEIDTAICFHGGVCKGQIRERLLTLTGYQKSTES